MLQFNEQGVGTHVLLIGVGDYPSANVAQLSSASTSLDALATWWMRGFTNPEAPLRSLDVVTSDGRLEMAAGTNFDALSDAIRAWHGRASAHPDNIAVFYFIGHGLQTLGGYALLTSDLELQDTGSSASRPIDQAISADDLVNAFRAGPTRQLWMFDTAREEAGEKYSHIRPRSPLTVRDRSSAPLRRLVLYAAHKGEVAFSSADGPSDFARAFLDTVHAHPDGLDTFELADGMAAQVRELRSDRPGAGIEAQSTSSFELIARAVEGSTLPSPRPNAEPSASGSAPTSSKQRRTRKPRTPAATASSSQDAATAGADRPQPGPRTPPPDLEFQDDDAQVEVDSLGRGALAVVVARRLHAIWKKSNPKDSAGSSDDRSGFVMHLDAPWGGGKTTFANFVARVLNPFGYGARPARFLRDRYGDDAGLGAIFAADPPGQGLQVADVAEEFRRPWIVIEYNAWRMEHTSPPWWTFYQVIRKGCFGAVLREGDLPVDIAKGMQPKARFWRRASRWAWLWTNEIRWRIWTPRVIVPLVVFALSVMIFYVLWLFGWIGTSIPAPGKDETFGFLKSTVPGWIMTGLAALTVIGGIASLIIESLAPGVDPLAERIGLGRSDPLERFRRHFHRTMCRLRRPVLVIIDDLDRCKPAVIVDLVRGIQTILRSQRVVFLVIGDRNWLECAFEAVHADMGKVVGGVEQSVGARFVEKTVQLSFLLPGLDAKGQKDFVADLLRADIEVASQIAPKMPAVDLRAAARAAAKAEPAAAFDSGQLRSTILETPAGQEFLSKATEELRRTPVAQQPADMDAEARRRASQIVNEEIAIQAAVASSVEAETAKRLEPLAPWLPSNPRQIKRILNGIALYHAAALQHPTFPTAQRWLQLAIWIVLMTEWPTTWRLLGACPQMADILCDEEPLVRLSRTDANLLPGSMAATQREVQRILNTPELMALVAARGGRQGDRLDTAAVRDLLDLTPPSSRLPRLKDEEPEAKPKKPGKS
ncbi:P-loop NTPase fold protein [Ensifer aridi]|uniref:P-loop NTPase fold protein n=1 Tax=Ensifer aridi TaxID=1708715 RepID=UPI000A1017BE|nr:P-loop NTPase fold protein [Ensifer aridi]